SGAMATAAVTPVPTAMARRAAEPRVVRLDNIWQAPLVPVALAATAGIVLDRYASVPLFFSLIAALAGIAAWIFAGFGQPVGLRLAFLWISVAALGAAYHHWFHDVYPADDIGALVTADSRPARLRGVIAEEPVYTPQANDDPLRSFLRAESTRAV